MFLHSDVGRFNEAPNWIFLSCFKFTLHYHLFSPTPSDVTIGKYYCTILWKLSPEWNFIELLGWYLPLSQYFAPFCVSQPYILAKTWTHLYSFSIYVNSCWLMWMNYLKNLFSVECVHNGWLYNRLWFITDKYASPGWNNTVVKKVFVVKIEFAYDIKTSRYNFFLGR